MGAVGTKYQKSDLVPITGPKKDIFIFENLYTIAIYEPTIAKEISSWDSNTIFVDYEWIGNWELDKYNSLDRTAAYELTGYGVGDPTKIIDVDKWKYIGEAWKRHLIADKVAVKPALSIFDLEYVNLVTNLPVSNVAGVAGDASVGFLIEENGRNKVYRYVRHLRSESQYDVPLPPDLMLCRLSGKQNKITAIHPLSYFPTNLHSFLSQYVFYDPSDPNMDTIMMTRYGEHWDFMKVFFTGGNKIKRKIYLSDIIKTKPSKFISSFVTDEDIKNAAAKAEKAKTDAMYLPNYAQMSAIYGSASVYLAQVYADTYYSYIKNRSSVALDYDIEIDFSDFLEGNKDYEAFPEATKRIYNYTMEFGGIINRRCNRSRILNTPLYKKNVGTYNGKPVDWYDADDYTIPPLEEMMILLKTRDDYIMSWIRGGPINTLPMALKKNLLLYYDQNQTNIYGDQKVFDRIYPIRLVRTRKNLTFGSLVQCLISAIPIVSGVVNYVKELKSSIKPEYRIIVDGVIIAAVTICTMGAGGAAAGAAAAATEVTMTASLLAALETAGMAALKMIVAQGIRTVLDVNGNPVSIAGFTKEEAGDLVRLILDTIDDKIKVVLCGIVMTIDNRFGSDAPGGSDTRSEYLLPPEAFAGGGTEKYIAWAAGIVAGSVLLKALLKKSKKET